jgi:hypothetical protein
MRKHYWSCSKFADYLRGTKKPGAQTLEGWRDWRGEAQTKYPFRYWLAEEGLDKIQNFIHWPIDQLYNLKYYINNRWVTKTHALTAHPRDIKPGEWSDVGNRFLPCLFNELQDYVEVELAWFHIAWESKEERKKYNTPFWAYGWFRWRTWRCPEAGLDNLRWQMSLKLDEEWVDKNDPNYAKPTQQAVNAKEIYDLYMWWTTVYRNRKDPMDLSGWSELCSRDKDPDNIFFNDISSELKEEKRIALDKCNEIELEYEKEDELMLIRLIRIRNSLWT